MARVEVPPPVGSSGQFIDAVVITSSTLRQINVIGGAVSSGVFAPVTAQGLGVVSASSGLVQISGTVAVVSASSGLVQISGNPTVLTASSGYLVRSLSSGIVTLSSVPTVTATAATNPWSSAPGFNVPVVNASSGLVQISGAVTLSSAPLVVVATSGGTVDVNVPSTRGMSAISYVSSSSGNSNLIVADGAAWYGYAVFNTTGTIRYVHFYQTSSAPGVGTTANYIASIAVPGSTAGGGGANLISGARPLNYSTKGLGFTITDGPSSTSTGISQAGADMLVTVFYSV